jgi:hypothetical protein
MLERRITAVLRIQDKKLQLFLFLVTMNVGRPDLGE